MITVEFLTRPHLIIDIKLYSNKISIWSPHVAVILGSGPADSFMLNPLPD